MYSRRIGPGQEPRVVARSTTMIGVSLFDQLCFSGFNQQILLLPTFFVAASIGVCMRVFFFFRIFFSGGRKHSSRAAQVSEEPHKNPQMTPSTVACGIVPMLCALVLG